MKKTVMIAMAGLLLMTSVKAQNLQEGINHLYADRFKSAIGVFEKLLASNPNNIEAAYWLGQTYLDEDKNDLARQLYDKTLGTSNNAPLILVGRGHIDLLDKKIPEGRQKFESAITATRGRKGDDPVILNAVGRAIVDANLKDQALNDYAVQLLKTATQRDEKNPDIWLNLGNAVRKAKPGEGGGEAFTAYRKALEINPNFSVAYLRLAKLFETQRNGEQLLENLNKAVEVDPKFSAAYYELFYYYFYRAKFSEAENFLTKYIDSRKPETYTEDEYLYAQLCWARKDFDCAIKKAEGVVTAMGQGVKPKVLKLLADAYFQKADYTNAKKYIDWFFTKEKPEDFVGFDYTLKADIYSKTPGQEGALYDIYLAGVKIDTVLDNKIEILKKAADFYKGLKQRDKEASLLAMILTIKPKPIINDYYYTTTAFYFAKMYDSSRSYAVQMSEKFPADIYGHEWRFNNSVIVDTVKKDSIAVPDAIALYEFTQKDTAKFKSQYLKSVRFLAGYYFNDARNKEKAIEFLQKWKDVDAAMATTIDGYIEQAKRLSGGASGQKTTSPAAVRSGKPAPPPAKTTKKATVKPAASKK
jgi:tetratricopeptide (TPR) repeat protein